MELKPGEIIAIVFALALPIAVFAVVFIPGGLNAVYNILLEPHIMPVAFFGGAGVAFGVFAWRIYRRIRPKARPDAPPHEAPKHMPKV
jgi:hypothetical protein